MRTGVIASLRWKVSGPPRAAKWFLDTIFLPRNQPETQPELPHCRFPNKSIDWSGTLLIAGYDDAPDLITNSVTVNALTIFYGGSVG